MNSYILIEKESKLMNISLETNKKKRKNKNINHESIKDSLFFNNFFLERVNSPWTYPP